MKSMKAVVKYADRPGATRIEEVPIPNIGPEDVLVRTAYIGVCGTDPHMHHNLVSFTMQLPLIFGHEFAGVIEQCGSGVTHFAKGDRVTAETHADYCGECMLCRTNRYHLCKQRKGYGFQTHGAFAKYVKVPQRILHRVPDSVSLKAASLTEPLCVAYKAVCCNSRVYPADKVLVIGPGPIGLLCAKMAALCGATDIITVGTVGDEKRLACADQYGATMTIDSHTQDASKCIQELTKNEGVDLVVDTAGVSQTLALSLDAVKADGQITKIGWGPKPVGFTLDPLIQKAATLRGHFSHTWDVWEKCLVLMEKQCVDLEPLITHEFPIDDWEKGFQAVENKEAIKVVLTP